MTSRQVSKNEQKMAPLWMLKFVLILTLFVIMTDNGYAGSYTPFLTETGVVSSTATLEDGRTFNIENRSNFQNDSWNSSYHGFTGSYTGYYLGSFNSTGNSRGGLDSEKVLSELIGLYLAVDSINTGEFYRVGNTTSDSDVPVTYNYNEPDDNSGTWSVTSNNSSENEYEISFYSVKGGNEFALYYADPAQSSGTWTTAHLQAGGGRGNSTAQPGISHMSVYVSKSSDLSNVPEPGTMLLLGVSLIGLAGLVRQRDGRF